jgi:hypothetical protein
MAGLSFLPGCGSQATQGDTGPTDAEIESVAASVLEAQQQGISQALAKLNADPMRSMLLSSAQSAERLGGAYRCGVGFAADFPDYVLVTIVVSSGAWSQISVHPETGIDRTSVNNGSDYRAAGLDDEFWNNVYPCTIEPDSEGSFFGATIVLE